MTWSPRHQQCGEATDKMVAPVRKPAVGAKGKKKTQTFVIDCQKPVEDKIMEIGTFEKYLHDKIKINNKTGGSS